MRERRGPRSPRERELRQAAVDEWRTEVRSQTMCPRCGAGRSEPCRGRRRAIRRVHRERELVLERWQRQHELEERNDRERARG